MDNPLPHGRGSVKRSSVRAAFSLIEMMIAIVILGLGLVMTATMFPVAWTRARSLTEYTTQRVVSQSAEATIAESLRPSGSSFTSYVDDAGVPTGKYFLSSGGLAGDLFYDPVLHTDPQLKLECIPPAACLTHRSVLIPSDIRVHALHMQNLNLTASTVYAVREEPFKIEFMSELCDTSEDPRSTDPPECRLDYPLPDYPANCANPNYTGEPNGARFCSRSFFWPQVGVGARMYPPMEPPPADPASAAFTTWLEKFGTRRFAWAALHRLRNHVGPINLPAGALPVAQSQQIASEAAAAAGTTRTFDFYIVTLKRAQSTSRFALQDPASVPDPIDIQLTTVASLPGDRDVSLPVAWRVQMELSLSLSSNIGGGSTGVPTEVQVPPTGFSGSAEMAIGMFPSGTQFVDEVNGQIFRVVRRRLNANGTMAFLTLDRELFLQDFDDSPEFGDNGVLDPVEILRTVWVYPPPIAERTGTTLLFDDSTPVVGIDVRTISMSPPG